MQYCYALYRDVVMDILMELLLCVCVVEMFGGLVREEKMRGESAARLILP